MSRENVEIVRRWLEAFENDEAVFTALTHPAMEWAPFEDNHTISRGLVGAMRIRAAWLDAWAEHRLEMISIEELIRHRRVREKLVYRMVEARLPTRYGQFKVIFYGVKYESQEPFVLVLGEGILRSRALRCGQREHQREAQYESRSDRCLRKAPVRQDRGPEESRKPTRGAVSGSAGEPVLRRRDPDVAH